MFTRSARYYDALYDFKDYAAASQKLHELIQRSHPAAESLLDLACGTGRHLEHLRAHYHVEGLDLNPELLEAARRRCPGVPFHHGDMAGFELGRRFDVVTCLFSSIAYVKTLDNLHRTIATMARHLRPGGVAVLEPWFGPDRYWTGTITANHVDQPELKIAWMYTSEREGDLSILDVHYLVGTPGGIEHFTERHELGLFTDEQYLAAFREAGLLASHDREGLFGRGLFLGVKPSTGAAAA